MVRAKGLVRLEVCLWTVMAGKRYKPEEIVAKLRQVDVADVRTIYLWTGQSRKSKNCYVRDAP